MYVERLKKLFSSIDIEPNPVLVCTCKGYSVYHETQGDSSRNRAEHREYGIATSVHHPIPNARVKG